MGARHDSNLLELISGACSEQREVDVSYVLFIHSNTTIQTFKEYREL